MKQNIDERLQKAAEEYIELPDSCLEYSDDGWEDKTDCDYVEKAFIAGANWQKEHLWKSADGEDLPEIGREVVAFQEIFLTNVDVPSLFKIVVAHRPNPEGYDGKSIATGEVEHYTPKTYGKGDWNIPDVRFWLDCSMPKEIEL